MKKENRVHNIKEQFQAIFKLNYSAALYALPITFLLALAGEHLIPLENIMGEVGLNEFDSTSILTFLKGVASWGLCCVVLWSALIAIGHQASKGESINLRDSVLLGTYKYKQLFIFTAVFLTCFFVVRIVMYLVLPKGSALIFIGWLFFITSFFWFSSRTYVLFNLVVVENLSWIQAASESNRRMEGKGVEMICHLLVMVVISVLLIQPEAESTYFSGGFYSTLALYLYMWPLSVVLYNQTKNKPHITVKSSQLQQG